ncbi:hypothetical protein Godav_001441 [Gossypium davidsonii]|uniref:Uncharacterized protein n=1 Tax=Gossypium davidsonii TaxID=34287 RepID=A0A7J8T336_GOSDV|nr:hypothetical protein [Gossypium davidsonii]
MMAILVQTGLKKVVIGKKPREYGITGCIDGEDLIRIVEKIRNSLCD